MAETLTIRTASSTEIVKIAVPGPQGPKGDKGDPGDVAGLPLTTQGDTLYRGASQNERLGIGTTGQVLKVSAQGLPTWANESGAVTSVNGATGAVTVAALNHTHEVADVFFQGLEILGAGNANTNGIYVYGGDLNGKGVFYKDKDTFIYWDGAAWTISHNTNDIYSSAQNTTTPWQVTSWSVEVGQTSPAPSSWDRLTGDQWEAVVGQRINPTLRGDAAGKNVGTGANDVAAGNDARFTDARQPLSHSSTHHTGGTDAIAPSSIGAAASGAITDSGLTSTGGGRLIGRITAGTGALAEIAISSPLAFSSGNLGLLSGTIPTASSATPSALGVAAAGTSANFARADHVHAMPSAADVGLGAAASPTFAGLNLTSGDASGSLVVYEEGQGTIFDFSADGNTKMSVAANEVQFSVPFSLAAASDIPAAQSATRTNLGLGTAATADSTDFATASHTHAASDITSGTLTHERGGLEADVSAYNGLVKISGGSTSAVTVTSAGEALLDDADAAAQRTTLGLGTAATSATGDFAAASHSHELTALAATGATNGHVLTANGSNGVTFAALPASGVTGAAASASDVLGVSGSNITGVDANADRIIFWDDSASALKHLTVGSGLSLTDTTLTATATGTIGGSTGDTDNLLLRSDGTGAATLQNSALQLDDATTSTQANVAVVNAHSETNSALVLTPKGTGAFIVGPKPDGTAFGGGNARGLKAVDLSYQRNAATQVASGNYSMVLGGDRCTASGVTAIAGGERATASGSYAVALGRTVTASGTAATVIGGQDNTASGQESIAAGNLSSASAHIAMALGGYALADRSGMMAQANGTFGAGTNADGTAQWIHMVLRAKTTTNSAVELLINNARVTNGRLTCPSGKIISGIINIHGVKSDGSASAHYVRQFQVKNVGGTSSYPYTAATVGTDYASSTSITFNDPDTNGDALSVSVTGIASETWRWTAHVSAVETTYGT